MKAVLVVGARPNFMKAAPLMREFGRRPGIEALLVHTGQHYDENMSKVFFDDLELPAPDIHLGVGSGSHAQQTARVMTAFEPVLEEQRPDVTIVVGDVNSTLACSVVSSKMHVPVAHVEAGLRSFDLRMPEEINRMVTDTLSRFCLTTCADADENLRREGVADERIFFVGNAMIDSLLFYLERAARSAVLGELGLVEGGYALVTLHRPSNVDDPAQLAGLIGVLGRLSERMPVLFPVHPRTRAVIDSANIALPPGEGVRLVDPLGYLDFLQAMRHSRIVVTDSGGIQEETTVLGIPCVTVRENTERPITIELGTNVLAGIDPPGVEAAIAGALDSEKRPHTVPPLWDGKAAGRIADVLERHLSK